MLLNRIVSPRTSTSATRDTERGGIEERVEPDTAEEDPLASAMESVSALGQRWSVKTVSVMRGGDRR